MHLLGLTLVALTTVGYPSCSPPPVATGPKTPETVRTEASPITVDGVVGRLVAVLPEPGKDEPGRGVLLLPSASFAAGPAWNSGALQPSWVEVLVAHGWNVFLLDFPGFGDCMDPPAPETFGAVRAAAYVGKAIDHIRAEYAVDELDLMGWSWGAQVAGVTAMRRPEGLRRLVLYGFTHAMRFDGDAMPADSIRPLVRASIDSDFVPGHFDPTVRDVFADAVLTADTSIPSGPLVDFIQHLPLVNPEALELPVLVISGQYELNLPPGSPEEYRPFYTEKRHDFEQFVEAGGFDSTVVPNGGHASHLDHGSAVWRSAVLRFLEL